MKQTQTKFILCISTVNTGIILQNSQQRVKDLKFNSSDFQDQAWSSHPLSLAYIITIHFTPPVYENG